MFGIPIPSLSEVKLIAIVVAAIGIGAGGFAMGFHWEKGALEQEKVANLEANAQATAAAIQEQKRLDGISVAAARKEAATQAAIASLRTRQLREVKKHVTDLRTRVPLGVVRLLDGAARGLLPDALVLPAGKSDGALSDLGYDDLARSVSGNYGTCRANAEQLDALTGAYRASRP